MCLRERLQHTPSQTSGSTGLCSYQLAGPRGEAFSTGAASPMGSSSSGQPCTSPGKRRAKDSPSCPLRSQAPGISTLSSLLYHSLTWLPSGWVGPGEVLRISSMDVVAQSGDGQNHMVLEASVSFFDEHF